MKEISKSRKWACLIAGILSIVVGVLVIVLACTQPKTVDTILSIIIAVVLFLTAFALILVTYIVAGKAKISGSLLAASIMIALGVFLCVQQNFIANFIKIVVGSFLCAIGGLAAINGGICISRKEPKKWAIIYFISAAAAIAVGVVILVIGEDSFKQAGYSIVGGVIALSGLAAIIYEAVILHRIRKAKKALAKEEKPAEEETKDAEVKEPEDKKEEK